MYYRYCLVRPTLSIVEPHLWFCNWVATIETGELVVTWEVVEDILINMAHPFSHTSHLNKSKLYYHIYLFVIHHITYIYIGEEKKCTNWCELQFYLLSHDFLPFIEAIACKQKDSITHASVGKHRRYPRFMLISLIRIYCLHT